MGADLLTTDHGTIITIEALSERGREWMAEYVGDGQPLQHCDHRMALPILDGALRDGLCLQDGATGRLATREDR